MNVSDVNTTNNLNDSKQRVFKKKSRVTKKDISHIAKALSWHLKYNKMTYECAYKNLEKFVENCSDVSVINMIEWFGT